MNLTRPMQPTQNAARLFTNVRRSAGARRLVKVNGIIFGALVLLVTTPAWSEDRTFGGMRSGESAEIRFGTVGCFHHEEAVITIARADRFETTIARKHGDEPVRVKLSDQEVAQLDELLAFYRTLEGQGGCTTTDTIGVLWRGPTIMPYIEPFTDATCGAPEAGHAVIRRLMGLLGEE